MIFFHLGAYSNHSNPALHFLVLLLDYPVSQLSACFEMNLRTLANKHMDFRLQTHSNRCRFLDSSNGSCRDGMTSRKRKILGAMRGPLGADSPSTTYWNDSHYYPYNQHGICYGASLPIFIRHILPFIDSCFDVVFVQHQSVTLPATNNPRISSDHTILFSATNARELLLLLVLVYPSNPATPHPHSSIPIFPSFLPPTPTSHSSTPVVQ